MLYHVFNSWTGLLVCELKPIPINPIILQVLAILKLFQVVFVKEVTPRGRAFRVPGRFKSTRHVTRLYHFKVYGNIRTHPRLDIAMYGLKDGGSFEPSSFNIGLGILVDFLLPPGAAFVELQSNKYNNTMTVLVC